MDGNLKELKDMIIKKRINMIQKREAAMHGITNYYDFFYGSTVFTAPQVTSSGIYPYPKEYIGKIESSYEELLRI